MDAVVKTICFRSWDGHAIVSGNDNPVIVQFTCRFQSGNDPAQVGIEMINFIGIIKQHFTAGIGIWQKVRYYDPGTVLITVTGFGIDQVRFMGTIPKVEWFIVIALFMPLVQLISSVGGG